MHIYAYEKYTFCIHVFRHEIQNWNQHETNCPSAVKSEQLDFWMHTEMICKIWAVGLFCLRVVPDKVIPHLRATQRTRIKTVHFHCLHCFGLCNLFGKKVAHAWLASCLTNHKDINCKMDSRYEARHPCTRSLALTRSGWDHTLHKWEGHSDIL